MNYILSNKINKLKNTSMPKSNGNWFELKNITDQYELSQQYATICHLHKKQKKWVLFINPDEASLEQLSSTHGVDISKILCVSVKGRHVNNKKNNVDISLNIEQIKSVLCRGNCSAVILSNAFLAKSEVAELNTCAQLGETQCVLLSTKQILPDAQGRRIH